ncbi:unnamed protein product [Leptidea sinapis]|uniref:Uncharacterized protein n=1 Tax=Leptidea sinapis TaxID=189913 RepID=A0A5E4QYJ6_9NEOP|nr:unnamed protein product [Leptidea sinapis]
MDTQRRFGVSRILGAVQVTDGRGIRQNVLTVGECSEWSTLCWITSGRSRVSAGGQTQAVGGVARAAAARRSVGGAARAKARCSSVRRAGARRGQERAARRDRAARAPSTAS